MENASDQIIETSTHEHEIRNRLLEVAQEKGGELPNKEFWEIMNEFPNIGLFDQVYYFVWSTPLTDFLFAANIVCILVMYWRIADKLYASIETFFKELGFLGFVIVCWAVTTMFGPEALYLTVLLRITSLTIHHVAKRL